MVIKPVESQTELMRCVELQRLVWGFEDRDLVSEHMLETSRKQGGLLLGAHVEAKGMVGFLFGFPSLWKNRLAQHSHMLAVLEEFRDQGIGYALKEGQYRDAHSRHVSLITWTFDPLESKNAYLNLNKLGVRVRRYYINLYGERTSSELHSGLGTDRFLAEWHVGEQAVEEILVRRSRLPSAERALENLLSSPQAVSVRTDERGVLRPSGVDLTRTESEILVEVPSQIQNLKRQDFDAALQWRLQTRAVFTHYLPRGYQADRLLVARGGPGLRTFYSMSRRES